ncbi:MAG: site-specific integrase [Chitinophagales bacterium]|nr:site-specific integrase [Chitinophagales bacterium]
MLVQEKKFLSLKLRPTDLSMEKDWYIEAYVPTHNGLGKKRLQIRGKINKGKTVNERLNIAELMISQLEQWLVPQQTKSILKEALTLDSWQLKPKTISAYTTVLNLFTEFLKGKSEETVTKQQLTNFFIFLHAKGINPNTIAKYRNTLHILYSKAIKHDLISRNPVDRIPQMKKNPKSLMYFNDAQIAKLKSEIEKNNPQLWLAVMLLYYCFIRPNEQRHLLIRDINLDFEFIEILGEHSKNGKTQKVVIPTVLKEKLQFLKQYPSGYFVLGKYGTPGPEKIGHKWLNDNHKRFLDKLQIVGRYAFYSWKHTGVVKCVQAGLNIRDIQNQLRHHSLDMLQEYLKNLGVLQSVDLRDKFPEL